MKRFIKSFLLMILFLTRIPLKYPYKYEDRDFIRGITLTPLVGLIIGIFIVTPFLLEPYIDKSIIVLLVWLLYVWITGGLHIDGLTDTLDGIFSNRDREKTLEIMSDSRIGAFGVIGFVFMMLFNLVLSYHLGYKFFIIMPIVGRVSSLVAASISKYAKDSLGMGTLYVENANIIDVSLGNILLISVFIVLGIKFKTLFLIPVVGTQLVAIFSTNYIKKKINGMTGDTIGLIVETSQTVYLFLTYLVVSIIC